MLASSKSVNASTAHPLHAAFLTLLPRIEAHARIAFRDLKCPHQKEECLAEMVALCWSWFLRLRRQGKDAGTFPGALASFAARQVRSGRRLCGQEPSRDALSSRAQRRHRFAVSPLPATSGPFGDVLDEALRDNTRTPPDEQAAFRADWPAWLSTRSERDRRLIEDLMLGERTLDAANKHGLSLGRVSQLRREFREDWQRYCGDEPVAPIPDLS